MKSPIAFACDPLRFQVEPQEYSTVLQTAVGNPLDVLTWTTNGTQTFDYNGRPMDSDHD